MWLFHIILQQSLWEYYEPVTTKINVIIYEIESLEFERIFLPLTVLSDKSELQFFSVNWSNILLVWLSNESSVSQTEI